jgi:hypothetical protein
MVWHCSAKLQNGSNKLCNQFKLGNANANLMPFIPGGQRLYEEKE